MPLIFDRFWPICDIEEKKSSLKIMDLFNLKKNILANNTRRASFWSSLKKFLFFRYIQV